MNPRNQKKLFLLLILGYWVLGLAAQDLSLLTWNIQDLGRTKDESELAAMVNIMKNHDIVMIQEVVAKDPAGARAVAKIADELNRKGAKWDYKISNPTRSPSSYISERYAFLWKTKNVKVLGEPFLDDSLAAVCDREPFIGKFEFTPSRDTFFLVNFHSRKHDNQPEDEIAWFSQYPKRLGTEHVFICGDFNLESAHPVWVPLKDQGFSESLFEIPTTLKRGCQLSGGYFNYAIDNIFYSKDHYEKVEAGRVDFVGDCENLKIARGISDHVPVYLVVRNW